MPDKRPFTVRYTLVGFEDNLRKNVNSEPDLRLHSLPWIRIQWGQHDQQNKKWEKIPSFVELDVHF